MESRLRGQGCVVWRRGDEADEGNNGEAVDRFEVENKEEGCKGMGKGRGNA